VADDFGNAFAAIQQDGNIQLSLRTWESINLGASFFNSTEGPLLGMNLAASGASSPDSFFVVTEPFLAVDNWTGDAHANFEYAVWSDNQTGSGAGYPAIKFMYKGPSATGWSAPVTISAPGNSYTYFMPQVSVAPGGAVWASFIGENTRTGNYREYGAQSPDGGLTWTAQFVISDQDSFPGDWGYMGQTTGLVATTNGAYPMWSDCRNACTAANPYSDLFTANVHVVSLSANIANVTATVSTFGQNVVLPLPANQGWDTGSAHTVTVPVWVPGAPNSGVVNGFQNYSGLSTSTNFTTSFNYNGVGSLVANYASVPASWIAGNFTPNVAGAKLTLDGTNAVTLVNGGPNGPLTFNTTVPSGGTYTLSAWAAKYVPLNVPAVPTTAHRTTFHDINLQKYTGIIAGRVTPANATVLLNDTPVTVPASGIYNIPEPWGWYWLNATSPGLSSASYQVVVSPNSTTTQNMALTGGWIWATVLNPTHLSAGFRIAVDGVRQNLTGNSFNDSFRGGLHTLTATEPGYNLTVISGINVLPGHATLVNVNLTNRGWAVGSVSPLAALKTAVLKIGNTSAGSSMINFYKIDPTSGQFNVSLIGGFNYTVNVSASGYTSFQAVVPVSAGNVSSYGTGNTIVVTLTPVTAGGCQVTNTCQTYCQQNPNAANCTTPVSKSNGGLSTTDLLLIVLAIIVVAAVIGVVMMTRRRGGASTDSPTEEEPYQPTYGESDPSELPKLQSDGSMGPGEEPPQ